MRSAELEARMLRYESARDRPIPPGLPIVVRLDGRGFYWFTWMSYKDEAPRDLRFRDLMAVTADHLLGRCQNALIAYCQGDEISLLFHPEAVSFGRKPQEQVSVLAGEASAAFSLALGHVQVFDARLSVLPGRRQVLDYFRWRMGNAARSCLDDYSHWLMRRGRLPQGVTAEDLSAMSVTDKQGLLSDAGIDFFRLPSWQKRGFAVYWVDLVRNVLNPITEKPAVQRLPVPHTDYDLPGMEEFLRGIAGLLHGHPFPRSRRRLDGTGEIDV